MIRKEFLNSVFWLGVIFPCSASEFIGIELEVASSRRTRILKGEFIYQAGESIPTILKLRGWGRSFPKKKYVSVLPYGRLESLQFSLLNKRGDLLLGPTIYTFLPFVSEIRLKITEDNILVRATTTLPLPFSSLPPNLLPVPAKEWQFVEHDKEDFSAQ